MKQILKSVKQTINYLQVAYHSGILAYPRVDNDYKRVDYSYDTVPHPPFPVGLSPLFEPLTQNKLNVDAKEILLLLSALDMISPSQIEGVVQYLDYYLDNNLKAKNEALGEEAKLIISILDDFLEDNNLTRRTLFEKKRALSKKSYENSHNATMFFQESIFFFSDDEEKRAKSVRWKKLINRRPDSDSYEFGGIVHAASLQEVFSSYDNTKLNIQKSHEDEEQNETLKVVL